MQLFKPVDNVECQLQMLCFTDLNINGFKIEVCDAAFNEKVRLNLPFSENTLDSVHIVFLAVHISIHGLTCLG